MLEAAERSLDPEQSVDFRLRRRPGKIISGDIVCILNSPPFEGSTTSSSASRHPSATGTLTVNRCKLLLRPHMKLLVDSHLLFRLPYNKTPQS